MSRKKSTKSKNQTKSEFNHTEYPKDKEDVHLSCKPQKAILIAEETPINALAEHANFEFSPDLTSKLPKHTEINDYAIELVDANWFIKPLLSPIQDIQVFHGFANFYRLFI